MGVLDGFTFHQLVSVPKLGDGKDDNPERPDPSAAQLFAALIGAHAELGSDSTPGAAMAVAWLRTPGAQRLRFLVGGKPHLPAATGDGAVLYPPGARGVPVDAGKTAAELNEFPVWLTCPGRVDPLWTLGPAARPGRRGGFDDYATHLAWPFAWLVLAEPLPTADVDRELLKLGREVPRLRNMQNDEEKQVALERAQARYRELSQARTGGMWRVRILVGGADEAGAQRAAALLCGASDLGVLPYVIHPGSSAASLDAAAESTGGEDANTPCSPFTASAEFLAAVARPPRRELPGIRLTPPAAFDVTPERDGAIHLGDVLDNADGPAGAFGVDMSTLNRHTFVAGATGSGKSQTVRHLMEQLHHADVPWLVIEPAKAEYAAMAGRIGADNVTVIRPGDPDTLPVGLNPLEPEPGFPIQTHIDLVRALFLAAFEADEPFPQVLSHALTRCYTDLGWDLVLGESRLAGVTPRYPTLADLQRTAMQVVEAIGYSKEITDNIRGFIDVRIGSLRLGTPGRFFEGGHPLDIADLLRRNVVLEIEDVGNDQDKAFFIGAILIRLHQHLRNRRSTGAVTLRHVTVIEEAHRLLKRVEPGSPAAHAVELFAALLAEIRAYGEGIVIAEQIPAKIMPDVIKNTALKIIHRLPAADDRQAVGATMNLDESQSKHIVSLPPGRAAVFTDGMDHPIRITVPLGEDREAVITGPSAAILSPRSVACGTQCQSRACTLRELNLAGRLADDPRMVLWIELLTVAHLVGKPAPRPDRDWLETLPTDRRTLECAIAHRVQAAIDTRYTGLADYYQPENLAEHLARCAIATVDGTADHCDGTEVEWQAGPYRWMDVFRALSAAEDLGDSPHPYTASWEKRGLILHGNAHDQLIQLQNHPDSWRPTNSGITGTETSPIYKKAAARLDSQSDPEGNFLAAIEYLNLDTDWPLIALDITNEEDFS
jgi:DNA helicase HerA-like ATPase